MYKFSIQYSIMVESSRQVLSGLTVKLVKPGGNWASGIDVPEAGVTGYYEVEVETGGFYEIWDDQDSAGAWSGKTVILGAADADGIGSCAVVESKIGTGAVTTDKLGQGAVTSEKMGEHSVTGEKIAPGEVTTEHLEENSITTEKVQDEAITPAKLSTDFENLAVAYAKQWVSTPYGSNFTYSDEGYISGADAVFPNGDEVEISATITNGLLQEMLFTGTGYIVTAAFNYIGSRVVSATYSYETTRTYLEETLAYVNVLNALNGGTPITLTRKNAIDDFIIALKASKNGSNKSIWDMADKIHLLANDSREKAAVNMKYPTKTNDDDGLGTLTWSGTYPPTMYSTDKGLIRANNANGYIDTRYDPYNLGAANGYKWGLSSATLAVFVPSFPDTRDNLVDICDVDINRAVIQMRKTSTTIGFAIQGTVLENLTQTPASGFMGVTRNTNNGKYYKRINDTEVEHVRTQASTLAKKMYLTGYQSYYTLNPQAFLFQGGGLTTGTGGQMAALKAAVWTYMIAMGVIA